MTKPIPTKSQNPSEVFQGSVIKDNSRPLVLYLAERGDHADMTYFSLLKQIIERCEDSKLSVRAFSEIGIQEYRVNAFSGGGIDGNPIAIEQQLKSLTNAPSKDIHLETTEFLDGRNSNGERRLIPMGSLKERWQDLVPQTRANILKKIELEEIKVKTPEDLLKHFKEQKAVDNPIILQVMEDDLKTGESKTAMDYYDKWSGTC